METDRVIAPRPAATLVVARQAPGDVEVLVLRRGARSRFLPGFVVFPGGAVDRRDARLAERWFGSPGQAARACAVRELAEEAGLAFTAAGLAEARGARALELVSAAPPAAGMLQEISRWIAPPDVPVRFDARFFAAEAVDGVRPSPDGAEADHAWWARPSDLLEDFAGGRRSVYWPTQKVLEGLSACRTVEEVLALRVPQVERDDTSPLAAGGTD